MLDSYEGLTVIDLTDKLEVTATAVRQRLDRLESAGYIERRKHSAGRGRPTYSYLLTDLGWRQVGVTYTDLVVALWTEISALEDLPSKEKLHGIVSKRWGHVSAALRPAGSLVERMRALAGCQGWRALPATYIHV